MTKEDKRRARQTAAKQKKTQKQIAWVVFIVAVLVAAYSLSKANNPSSSSVGNDTDGIELFEDDHMSGGENARATLVEYGDFQCPACGRIAPVVAELKTRFGDDLRVVFRQFPLTSIHEHAQSSAQAAEAAGLQGKFWEMHDILFERQSEWSAGAVGNPLNFYTQYAEEIGLDLDQFGSDFNSGAVKNKVRRDAADARSRGLGGTPSFILNGEQIQTPRTVDGFADLIQAAIDNAPVPTGEPQEVHEHADLAVYINGNKIDFSGNQYQSTEDHPKHDYTHFHDGVGHIVHKHLTGVTLGDLFDSVGVSFSKACLSLGQGESYCNTNTKSLKFYVNGKPHTAYQNYEIQDLDQILISYGPVEDSEIEDQIASVTDEACIYSEVCPERGTPPTEACVGGLGTTCDEGDHTQDE